MVQYDKIMGNICWKTGW